MVEVVVDQKRAPLPPVDPDVKIPEAVKRRAAAVDAYYAANGQNASLPSEPRSDEVPTPQAVDAIPPASPPAALSDAPTVAPVEQTVEPAPVPVDLPNPLNLDLKQLDPNDASWQKRFLDMQGRYSAAQKTIGEMQEQMTQLGDELLQSRRPLPQSQPAAPLQSQQYLTDRDVQNYGTDLIDFTQRAAIQAVQPRLQYLQGENEDLRQQLQRETRVRLDMLVESEMPNYREIDSNPRWHQWLRLPEPYSGRIRQELLNDAIAAASAPRVLSFFKGFLAEEQALGHSQPVPASQPAAPPREPAVSLASLAAPGRARPAGGGDTSLPTEKPFYTRAQIKQNYRDHQQGRWIGREADWDRLERDMIAAPLEGRVR